MPKTNNKKTGYNVVCKKIKLHALPVIENKNWCQRVEEYFNSLIDALKNDINKYDELLNSPTHKQNSTYQNLKLEVKHKIKRIEDDKKRFLLIKDSFDYSDKDEIFIKKIANNYTIELLKRACKSEAKKKNSTLSYTYSECLKNGIDKIEDIKERTSAIDSILKYCTRVKSKTTLVEPNSLLDEISIDNPLGGYGFGYSQMLRSKFLDAVKEGLFEGKVTLDSFKTTGPVSLSTNNLFVIPGFDLIGTKDYKDLEHLIKNDNKRIFIVIGRKRKPTVAKMYVDFGSKKRENKALYSMFYNIIKGEYIIGGSTIQVNQKNEIILNLTVKKPVVELETTKENKKTVVGVALGKNIPIVCAINNSEIRKYIGNKERFLSECNNHIHKRRNLNNIKTLLTNVEEKRTIIVPSKRLRTKKTHWEKNYNHYLSRQIINFALENKAKVIQLENTSKLSSKRKKNYLLGDWSYFQLQNFIEYKAKEYGISVKYVNTYKLSNTCSKCGKENKEYTQGKYFFCNNPDCSHNEKQISVNADYNFAKNISLAKN